MSTETILAQLTDAAGFTGAHGDGLFGNRGKASFEIWNRATARGVSTLYSVRRERQQSTHYLACVFAEAGSLNPAELSRLVPDAAAIPLETIVAASQAFKQLEPMLASQAANDVEAALGDRDAARHGFIVTAQSARKLNFDCVIWAVADGIWYVCPVKG